MNLNATIKNVLKQTGLPVEQDAYDGKEEKYIIFAYEDETPAASGDNEVTADTAYLQIQLITPKNYDYFKLKHEIRDLLEEADFCVTSIRSFLGDVFTGTEKTRQTVFNVEYTEGRK